MSLHLNKRIKKHRKNHKIISKANQFQTDPRAKELVLNTCKHLEQYGIKVKPNELEELAQQVFNQSKDH